MRPLIFTVFLLLTSFCASFAQVDSDEDCSPDIADRCFLEVQQNLQCQLSTKRNPFAKECTGRGVDDFCSTVTDALSCTEDMVDVGCSQEEGRNKFDKWLKGLRAVASNLCLGDRKNAHDLLENPDCWNSFTFLTCTQKSADIDHINDLLTYDLDHTECDHLLAALSICNMNAASSKSGCTIPSAVISELMSTFFEATACTSADAVRCPNCSFVILILALLHMALNFLCK